MASLEAALDHLGFDRASSDADRVRLLVAIRQFGYSVNDSELASAATDALPAANPFFPPGNWMSGFEEGFRSEADVDCNTDPDSGRDMGNSYWSMLSDAERRERAQDDPQQGFRDGQKEARDQNELFEPD